MSESLQSYLNLIRFWLASCVEAFLRGADVQDQVCPQALASSSSKVSKQISSRW